MIRPPKLVLVVVAVLALAGIAAVPARGAPTARLPVADAQLLNYYPASHGWAAMWTQWDGAEFDRDMGRIASLGANAVRLVVQPRTFGFPAPAAPMQARLAEAVGIAGAHGLSVELTLFDWFKAFGDLEGSKAWATAMLSPFAHDPRVFAVELQNELPVENAAAVEWAGVMLPHLASITPAPTTVSVNGRPTRLATLKALLGAVRPSFWSYHYYDQVQGAGASNAFAAVKAIAAPELLFIGETGVDSMPRLGESETSAAARQDHFFRAVFAAAAAHGLPVPAPWTLTDFTLGSVPGRPSPEQYAFGLFRTDGRAKPAAATVARAFR